MVRRTVRWLDRTAEGVLTRDCKEGSEVLSVIPGLFGDSEVCEPGVPHRLSTGGSVDIGLLPNNPVAELLRSLSSNVIAPSVVWVRRERRPSAEPVRRGSSLGREDDIAPEASPRLPSDTLTAGRRSA
mmetsp:Transcript_43735/g.126334  ORF Transcript_43735/g.126334 Transcript_43735/m.126334 type:complete len:128 (-) Transcript_43735:28-411(-)